MNITLVILLLQVKNIVAENSLGKAIGLRNTAARIKQALEVMCPVPETKEMAIRMCCSLRCF